MSTQQPQKKISKLAYALIGAAGLGTLLIGVPAFQDQGPAQIVAEVNGQEIARQQLDRIFSDLRARAPAEMDDSTLRQAALDSIITQALLTQHALASGYQFSDQSLYQYIKSEFGDEANYQRMLDTNRVSAQAYQESIRQSQSVENYYRLLSIAAMPMANQAAIAQLSLARDVSAVRIPLEPFAAQIMIEGDEALKQYYQEHQQDYLSQPWVDISYLLLSPEQLASAAQISPEQLAEARAQREANIVRGGKYLIFDNASDAEKVATELTSGARSFADVLADVDAGKIAGQAGDLNPNAKGKGISKEVDEALFALANIGDVSPVFTTEYGSMLVQLGSIEGAEAIDDAKLSQEIALAQSNERFVELANSLFDAAQTGTPLADLAKQAGIEMQHLEHVQSDSQQADWLASAQVQEVLFGSKALAVNSPVQPVDLGNRSLFIVVKAREEAMPQPFEIVREKVLQDYKNAQAKAAQQAAATAIEQALNTEGDITTAVTNAHGELKIFKQISYLSPTSTEIEPFVQAVLLEQNTRIATHELADNSIMVARIDAMNALPEAQVDEQLRNLITQESQMSNMRNIQAGLGQWLRAHSKIRVDNTALAEENSN